MDAATAFPSTLVEDAFVGNSGPWGSLEHLWFSISPPVDFVEHYDLNPLAHPWRFPNFTRERLAETLAQCGVDAHLSLRLLAAAADDIATQGLSLFATPDLVREIPADARARLYAWLAQHDSTSWQANAFRFCGESLEAWFRDAPLAPATIERVRPFIYRHGPFLMLADLPAVSEEMTDRSEFARLVKALAREATLLVKLNLRHCENIEPLVRYWGRGGRERQVRPLLESLAQFRRGQSIDIVHLLPAFARRLLYTYPRPAHDGHDVLRDCHWSSLNFFADQPDDQLLNINVVCQTIARHWRPSDGAPLLGDLALFHDARGTVFHSAIYVADDILFTKNGPAMTRPWMLMKQEHLRHFYPQSAGVQVRLYRRLGLD